MKHKHHDIIVAWEADTTKVVQSRRNGADCEWQCVLGAPQWVTDFEYRFMPVPKPDVVRYLALNWHNAWEEYLGAVVWSAETIRIVRDGETGKLKSAEVLK